jgi:hypothetical protein
MALRVHGDWTGDYWGTSTISRGNTFNCTVKAGITEQGEDFNCISGELAFGSLRSLGDTCIINRQDAGPYHHHYALFLTDENYLGTVPRSAVFDSPTLILNLPASHFDSDAIGFFYLDQRYLTVTISNPRYQEIVLGSGWTAGDKAFSFVDGWRPDPPEAADTFLKWDGVTQAPDTDIVYSDGASSSSITLQPLGHLVAENFGSAVSIPGAALGSTCDAGEMRYDTGGATKELCICDPVNTWSCVPLTARRD